ncbi:DUF1376 domain-containing protein [Hymenobacter taeanensis]|uniref:DUF1376 domain-containing protein n=1 Tax=Hymenobacter taeanensis TaxID=2735321 RepID=A0A6M6BIF6_9BACT|nr:DUF1376 domain-containing protein [Hymenobacter taeanensis]QJX47809.1 DUF1376 domain-containing protein [Hymenobacter taeanensis]
MKPPAFLLYTGDFLSSPDVQLMGAHEVGAYCLLLFNSWQSDRPGYLPAAEDRLRRTGRLTVEQWAESRDLLLGKFPLTTDGTARYNPRLLAEAHRQAQHRELKTKAGLASAAKRAAQATGVAPTPTPVASITGANDSDTASSTAPQQLANRKAAHVGLAANTCSENDQQTGNLSFSLSLPSSLRSEGEGAAAPSAPAPGSVKRKSCPPTLAEVQAYAAYQHPGHPAAGEEAAAFFDHFESNGWRVGGKTPMVDWRAAFRNWMRRRPQFQPVPPASATPARARTAPKPADPSRWS